MKRIENLKRYIPFLCLFVIMLVFHAFMIEDPNRDAIRFFSHAFDEGSLGEFLKMRWNTWYMTLELKPSHLWMTHLQ